MRKLVKYMEIPRFTARELIACASLTPRHNPFNLLNGLPMDQYSQARLAATKQR